MKISRLNAVLPSSKLKHEISIYRKASICIFFLLLIYNNKANAQFFKNLIDTTRTDTSHHAKKKLFIAPVIGYSPETRFFFGAGAIYYLPPPKKYPDTHPSALKCIFDISQNDQIESNFTGESYFRDNLYKADYTLRYYKYPDYFFGIGNYTLESDKEEYDNNFFNTTFDAQRKVAKNFYAGGKTFFEYTHVLDKDSDGLLATQDITGADGGINTGLGLWFTYDSRNKIYFPTKGRFADASIVVHNNILGSDFNYLEMVLEYSQFYKVLRDDVIAYDVYAQFLPGDPPFDRMAQLGGDTRMRGNYFGRFRDKYYLTGQMEYRITFWKYFGITVFGGLGEVSDTFSHFSLPGLKYSLGAGGRLFIVPEDKLSLRVDYAFGSEGQHGAYVTFREAF